MTTPTKPLTDDQKEAVMKGCGNAIARPLGCFSCAVQLFGIVLLVWLLTHISVIWSMLDRIVR